MFGGSAKCARCGKAAYAAEQKLAEGQKWHAVCWSLEFKEREAAKKAAKNEMSYNKIADANASDDVREAIQSGRVKETVPSVCKDFDPTFSSTKKSTAPLTSSSKPVSSNPNACARCGKQVYHAEQRREEGLLWHQACWTKEFSDRSRQKKQQQDDTSYNKQADVQPEYYRVQPVGDSPSSQVQSTPASSGNSGAPAANFCSQCGTKADGSARFCASCGTKLQ